MPIERSTNAETEAAVAAIDKLHGCEIGTLAGWSLLRIRGDLPAGDGWYYIPHEHVSVMASLKDARLHPAMVSADAFDDHLAAVEGITDVEIVEVVSNETHSVPAIAFVAPEYGHVDLRVHEGVDPKQMIRRTARERRQDAEGRTISRLGAMTLALAARDHRELNMIVDTIFMAGKIRYHGVEATIGSDGRIVTIYDHQGVQMRSDGIEIADLPETVRTAIKGRQRRRLGEVVEIPGFDDLDITGIYFNALSAFTWPGKSWIRLDVRDANGAKFDFIEIDEAREVARRTFDRRTR